MDQEGWLPLSTIANFNRMQYLTNDFQLLCEVAQTSAVIEYRKDSFVRLKNEWKNWIFPPSSTTTSATTSTTITTTTTNDTSKSGNNGTTNK